MHFLNFFFNNTIKNDLINRFLYSNLDRIPKFKKIVLNFGSKTADLKQLSSSMLAFEFIINQKAVLKAAKKPNILIKIRKGNPTGCKLILKKLNVFIFFEKILIETFFKKTTIYFKLKKNVFSFKIYNIFNFYKLKNNYYFFNKLSKLDVFLITTCNNKKELLFLLRSLQFI